MDQPSKWAMSSLADVCQLITDGTHHSPPNAETGDFMYVTAKNVKPWGLDISDITFVDKARHEEIYSRCPAKKGDVLYIKDGVTAGLAAVNHLENQFSMLSSVALLRPDSEVLNSEFLKHWLNSPLTFSRMTGGMTGSAIRRIILKQIRSAEISIPPLNEQRRIAAKLDATLAAVDACRQRLDGVEALLKRFRKAVLAAASSGELTREWREEMSICKDWKACVLDDIASIQGGITKDSKKQLDEYPEFPYLRVANVQRGYLDLREIAFIRVPPGKIDSLLLEEGDILFNEGGDRDKVGRGWVWEGQIDVCVFQNHVFRARLLRPDDQPKFVSWWSNTCGVDHFLGEGRQTTNLASISKKTLGQLPIQMPPPAEQTEIIDRVQSLFSLADQLEARLTSARKIVERLTPALLAKAFRGELVPQDPNDEPASVLLERIRAARQAEAAASGPSRRGRRQAAASPEPSLLDAAPVPPDRLANLLRECGALSERALLAASELDPAEFRAQLALERELGAIQETLEDGQVLLEAVG
jgi:type I restriction enzyme S subunit